MGAGVAITGRRLTLAQLWAIACEGAVVSIEAGARARMQAAAELIRRAAVDGRLIYGVTTGLGSQVVERVDPAEASAYSLVTIRGRAMAVGDPLPDEVVRAAMAVRCSGLCAGGSGAGPAIAEGLAALLNAGVHPLVPAIGSVGASDLCLLAHIGLTLIGEGEARLDGRRMDSAAALAATGLEPVALGPRDGLAICSSSAVSVGAAGLALVEGQACLEAAQSAAALSMEGFRASLTPIDPRVVAARPAPGQAWAADGLRELLRGGTLTGPGGARRLQDPLSLRCASQVHGSLYAAFGLLEAALEPELAGAGDNPLVLLDDDEILSTGNFHTPALALALDAAAIGVAQVASVVAERAARLLTGRLTGLPQNLTAAREASRSGFAPLMKTAQALAVEIKHLAASYAVLSTSNADAVEDDSTASAQAAIRLREQLQRLWRLVAVEMIVAAQALELAAPARLGTGTAEALAFVRETVGPLRDDRPLGIEVEHLARRLRDDELQPERK